LERAFAYLESNASAHFDPECVKVFLARKDEVLAIRLRFQDEAPDDF